MKISLFIGNKLVLQKEMKPSTEWTVDPIFLEGVGDDSRLCSLIREYLSEQHLEEREGEKRI